MPESLHRNLWRKLKFEDYDIFNIVKVIIDEEDEIVNLIVTKQVEANCDVYLIDHAWTFNYQDAAKTLLANPNLLSRLEKITEYSDKREITNKQEECKTKNAQVVFKECMDKGGRVFDMDEL